MNDRLHEAVQDKLVMQYSIAERAGMTPVRLSQIIHGVRKATADERRRLAKVLKVKVKDIF